MLLIGTIVDTLDEASKLIENFYTTVYYFLHY